MPYDERYTEYIRKLGLLPFIQLVSRSTPNFNPSAISALVDRWRPETHSFHLQDVSMILALPIRGKPVCFSTESDGWRKKMFSLIGACPPEKEESSTDRVSAGATFVWIRKNFAKCPEGADEVVIQNHARAYVWYVITRTLFADSSGWNAPWIWLKALTLWESNLSWGTAALAYLYRQVNMLFFSFISCVCSCLTNSNLCTYMCSWTKRVVGGEAMLALVVQSSYFRFGCGSTSQLDGLSC